MEQERGTECAEAASGPHPLPDFGTFMAQNYRDFLKSLMVIGATREDAEDAIEKVITKIVDDKTWGSKRNPKAWIRKAVLHTYYDYRKREHMRPGKEFKSGYAADVSGIDHEVNAWEDAEWVNQMLDTLPSTQRSVLELNLEGWKATEIADLLGKSPDAIRQHLCQARKRLILHLGTDYRIAPTSRSTPAPRKEDTT